MADEPLAGDDAYLRGKPCPKCAYARRPTDTNPQWQCPKCLIAYAKYRPTAAPLIARIAGGGREIADEAKADSSAYTLVAANLLALVIAAVTGMTLRDLAIVYCVQGVIISVSFFIRVLCLPADRVTRTLPDGTQGPVSRGEIFLTAFCILLLLGAVHFFYGGYIFALANADPSTAGLLLCSLVFVLNHGYSLVRNIRLDRRDQLRLGTLLSIPFFRILPMHFLATVGLQVAPLATGLWGLLLFTLLKSGADVVTHVVEHHELRLGGSLRWLRDAHFDREMQLRAIREREPL